MFSYFKRKKEEQLLLKKQAREEEANAKYEKEKNGYYNNMLLVDSRLFFKDYIDDLLEGESSRRNSADEKCEILRYLFQGKVKDQNFAKRIAEKWDGAFELKDQKYTSTLRQVLIDEKEITRKIYSINLTYEQPGQKIKIYFNSKDKDRNLFCILNSRLNEREKSEVFCNAIATEVRINENKVEENEPNFPRQLVSSIIRNYNEMQSIKNQLFMASYETKIMKILYPDQKKMEPIAQLSDMDRKNILIKELELLDNKINTNKG